MTGREVVKRLRQAGWFESANQKHTKMQGPNGRVTVIPTKHRSQDLPKGTIQAIERQTGVRLA